MRLSILFLLIFNTTAINAQLYISSSEKSDGYIYVKDRLIFVENNIELARNSSEKTKASLYLRKGAQLLQGEKAENLNKGIGALSIYQRGTSNAFDYNYWSLPVKVEAGKTLLNEYLYEPLSNLHSNSIQLISGLEGVSNPLSISNRWIYTFSGTSYSNWQYVGNHFDLLPGEGFSMKGVNGKNLQEVEGEIINSGNAQLYDFRGIPNDGKIQLPINKEQVLLVGNPYPSALDLNKFLFENTFTTGIAYFWDSRNDGNSHYLSDYEGGYGTYSPGAGIYLPAIFKKYIGNTTTGESGKIYPRKNMPVTQGFMVRGSMDGEITFENSQRIYQKEAEGISFFKNSEPVNSSVILNIEFDSTFVRQLALSLHENSTVNEDHAKDARMIDVFKNDVSWLISEKAFLINVRPRRDEELIPFLITLDKDTSLKFSVEEFTNFNPDRLFIYDAQDDLYFGIKAGSLNIKLSAGEYRDRFFLSFIEKLPVEETKDVPLTQDITDNKPPVILLNTLDIFQNNSLGQLEVKILHNTSLHNLKLYDLNGKLFMNQDFRANEKDFIFSTGNLSNAVYIVKVKTNDNRELTKKIGVKN